MLCTDIFVSGLNYDKALVFGGKHRNLLACGSEIISVYLLKPVLYHTLNIFVPPSKSRIPALSHFPLHSRFLSRVSQADFQEVLLTHLHCVLASGTV